MSVRRREEAAAAAVREAWLIAASLTRRAARDRS
jgi:hypothetical protein